MLQAFTSYVLIMFRTLIYLSSGACDYSVELPHWSYFSVKTEDLALHIIIYANAKSSVFTEQYDQLCQYKYIYCLILVQLHVSAFIGHLQVVLRDVDEFY